MCSCQSLNSSVTIISVNCHLLTPDDSAPPPTPPVKAQKQESLKCSNPFPSFAEPYDTAAFVIYWEAMMCNMDEDDDDDDISGMELAYPE